MMRWVCGAAIVAGLLILGGFNVHAQSGDWNDGHHLHHTDFYQDLKQPDSGYSCCNKMEEKDGQTVGDCRPVRAYKGDDDFYYVFISGKWKQVPSEKVLNIPSPDGYAHVCAHREYDWIYCFIMGESHG